jgi:hypothetical protein
VLSPHTWLIAAIFIPYAVMMAALFGYMWLQVRRHLNGEPPDTGSSDDQEDGRVWLAA